MFQALVEDDSHLFDIIYKQLATLEQEIPKDNARFFHQKMYIIKQTIYELFRYYQQLTELAEDLMEWECDFLDAEELEKFDRFITRTSRLADDMEIMREYAMEIWEIYQSQISIKQNDIMKVLTVVTTVFLPLTLLVGWYGMNFQTMPELTWKYGYVTVIFASICIVAFLLLFFRKKKYW
jgi:magnesium transporter